jgi:hypothetical protein
MRLKFHTGDHSGMGARCFDRRFAKQTHMTSPSDKTESPSFLQATLLIWPKNQLR